MSYSLVSVSLNYYYPHLFETNPSLFVMSLEAEFTRPKLLLYLFWIRSESALMSATINCSAQNFKSLDRIWLQSCQA